jgi:diguanylate cyclase (GGDEF)-like protein
VRVLVADDDPTCRLITRAVVEQLGYECLTADDGARAWKTLTDQAVDVLVTDWMMPGLDGPELCRRVRTSDDHSYTYIILATSLNERDDIVAGMEAGADDYLIKPLDPFDVRTRLIAAERVTDLHRQLVEFRDELERLNAEVALQARTDPLTRLGNRLRLHEDLTLVHERARRTDRTYAVALCDLDFFKSYNDTYGHAEGDRALRLASEAIARECRAYERAYRYGGEEFVIVFGEATAQESAAAGERLRGAVEAVGLPHPANPPVGVMTISVGVAAWEPGDERDPAQVIGRADEALYGAKERGRNCVMVSERESRQMVSVVTGSHSERPTS